MTCIKKIACWLFVSYALSSAGQSPAVLSKGTWYKFSVAADGVVKLDYNTLRNAGLNLTIDPRNIKIYTGQAGMLPQANSVPRKADLTEIAIQVVGESDGQFNTSDLILFYAQGPDTYSYDEARDIFAFENNLFSDKNYYFLTVGTEGGKRIQPSENVAGSFPIIQDYDDMAYYETERYNILKSGRQWFGEQFDATLSATIRFELPHIVEGSELKLISHVMAQSTQNSSFKISINNNDVLTQPVDAWPNTTYGAKGVMKIDTVLLQANALGMPGKSSQDVRYQFTKGSPGISIGYLDYFILTLKRMLVLSTDQFNFRASQSTQNSTSTFRVSSATTNTRVWNVTNPDQVAEQQIAFDANQVTFSTSTQPLQTFATFQLDKLSAPTFEGLVQNQNLHGLVAPDLLIITNQAFEPEANRLADHRRQQGISVTVVNTLQIFNEFAGGKQDVTAIRDFIRYLYNQTGSRLKNVLLVGRGSYDYKERVLGNTNYIPIYESRNSLSPLQTYGSDDYYTFLEVSEGEWKEFPVQNHTMDVGIGRLPVKNITEAKQVIDKLIAYDNNPAAAGAWVNEMLFVADDGDNNIHNSDADQLADAIESLQEGFITRKFFLDSYEQEIVPVGQRSPKARSALDREFNKGALIINFTGHGNEKVWMDERILDDEGIKEWRNSTDYPLLITATCEFGRHDDPFQTTSGELTLIQKNSGSIGLITSTRPVFSNTNFVINSEFYNALFIKESNRFRHLGSIFKDAKNNSAISVLNRNFSLLGDPSMKLKLPEAEIKFTEITSTDNNELSGLSKVQVSGITEMDGTAYTDFNGELTLTLFDQEVIKQTLGDENAPFEYTERSNVLFKGKTTITDGSFNAAFILPKNISSTLITGKFVASAFSTTGVFANGNQSRQIGGLNLNASSDNTAPTIRLFLGDTTFIPGGIVGPETKMVALLSDASGINTSSNPSGNEIKAVLDADSEFILSNYYVANLNTFQKGTIEFPLKGLESGRHTLTLTASDTYNNKTTTTVDFVVTEGDRIEIEEFNNYPNPFYESTTLEFTHTRPGEDLEVFLAIYDMIGNNILNQTYEVPSSQYRVTLSEWDGRSAAGTKLGRGVYLGKLSVRSLLDGSKNEQFTKLILLN